MARIRTIKPELPQSESLGKCSRDARLTFILLFTMADDGGRLRGNSRMLASLLFPYDDDAKKHIDAWLCELDAAGCTTRYQVNGDSYLAILNWTTHQKIDKPTPSKLPAPPEDSRILANPRDTSFTPADFPSADRKGKEGNRSEQIPPPDGVGPKVWADFLQIRKAKRAPLTDTALDGIQAEADKAGYTLEQALKTCCLRGWQGFKASWVAGDPEPQEQGGMLPGAI